jgi:hypothetical protein
MPSRREFLSGAGGAVLLTAWPCGAVAMLTDAALLAELTAWELDIVQQAMANHPTVPLVKTIEMLRAFGM